ncbi:MAG: ABC transporter permease, partial [Bullifex sp.]
GKKEVMATPMFLARHGLNVGDKVTCVFRTASGGTNAATFTIVGRVAYLNAEMNGDVLITTSSALSPIVRINDGALEIHLWIEEGEDGDEVAKMLTSLLSGRGLAAESWHQVSWIYPIMPLYNAFMVIITALFFFIASTLVFNTMMMSALERKKELSTMIAIGFSRRYVMMLLVAEGMIIAAVSALAAALTGKIIITVFGIIGIDLTAFGVEAVEGWGFPNILYLTLDGWFYPAVIAAETAVSAAAGILATLRVRKLEVAESLREEA